MKVRMCLCVSANVTELMVFVRTFFGGQRDGHSRVFIWVPPSQPHLQTDVRFESKVPSAQPASKKLRNGMCC